MDFSIIVPAYNAEFFLPSCIASVQAQRVENWELIVVNDGSTDGTEHVLDYYKKADSRIHVFSQENKGQFYARQKGIDMAKGKYIIFLDSDDELRPDCLSTLEKKIRQKSWDVILYTGRIVVDGCDCERRFGFLSSGEKVINPCQIKEWLIASDDLNSLATKAFRRELFVGDNTNYSDFEGVRYGEDKVRLLYPITNAIQILYIPNCLYSYHYRHESITHFFDSKLIQKRLSDEMFSMLQYYMEIWGMTDKKYREQLGIYQMKRCIDVYFGFRKRCNTYQDKRKLRQYPWREYMKQLPQCYRKLGIKDQIKVCMIWLKL